MSSVVKIYALFIGSSLLMFGGGLTGLLLAVRGAEEGFSVLSLGLIGTSWSVGFITGSILVPRLVQRVGHIRAYSVMAAVGTVTVLLNLLFLNDVSWIVIRAFTGFCFAGAAMIMESWLNEVADNRSRGTIFSIYTTINLGASTVGQIAMAVIGTAGYVPFVVSAISFICAVLPSALTSTPQPRPLVHSRLDVRLLYKTSPIAVIASFSAGMANGSFGSLAPVFGYARGMDAAGIAVLFSVTILLGAIGQVPVGRLSDRHDRRLVMIGLGGIGALVGSLLLVFNPSEGPLLYILFGLYGFAAYSLYPIAVAHANDFAKEGEFARVAGGMLLVYGTGLAIGPPLSAWFMNMLGEVGLFVVTTLFHALLALTAYLRMRVRAKPVGRGPFRPMATAKDTPQTVLLDPRSEDGQESIDKEGPVVQNRDQ